MGAALGLTTLAAASRGFATINASERRGTLEVHNLRAWRLAPRRRAPAGRHHSFWIVKPDDLAASRTFDANSMSVMK